MQKENAVAQLNEAIELALCGDDGSGSAHQRGVRAYWLCHERPSAHDLQGQPKHAAR